jgi:hypothetical protein
MSLVFALLILSGCEDEPVPRDYPRVKTLEVTNITGNGATFVAEVTHEGTVPITEHGFTWALSSPDITRDEIVNLGSFSGKGRFEAEIGTTLGEGTAYEVCAFIKAGEYTVYGDKVKFMSLGSGAPEITDFMPKSAGWGDTVTILGQKFSYLNITNKILIEECICWPFYASDTLLKFILLPEVVKPENSLSVSILGNVASTPGKLILIPPEAYGFSPRSGHWGDTITVTGRYLSGLGRQFYDGMWLNGNLKCMMVMKTGDFASFVIPGQLNALGSSVTLSYSSFIFSFPDTLKLLPPQADSISPCEGTWGTAVTLYGRFNNITLMNRVLFGDKQAQIIYSSYNSIVVKVPDNLTDYESTIRYTSGSFTSDFAQSFTMKEPEIIDFEPKQGYVGNLVTVRGRYFKKNATTVEIGGKLATLKSANDSVITCSVPGDIYGECSVAVTSLGHTTLAEGLFNATNHVITDVTPLEAINGDTITLSGTNFRSGTDIYLGPYKITPFSIMENEIRFVVPQSLSFGSWTIMAKYAYLLHGYWERSDFTYPESLVLRDFTITDVTPLSGEAGDLLTITGTNFRNPVVTFGSVTAEVMESTTEQITVKVPPLPTGDHMISITIGVVNHQYPFSYTHSGPWYRLADLPFLYLFGCVFDFGEEVYIATGGEEGYYTRAVYRFEPGIAGFSKMSGTWETGIIYPISCTLDGKGYIIGNKELGGSIGFEVFNPDSLTWRALPDFPGRDQANLCLVADDSVIYAGCGSQYVFVDNKFFYDFWKYSPATNRWTRLADSNAHVSFTNHVFIDGRLLFLGYQDFADTRFLLEYHPQTDTWSQEELNEEDLGFWGLNDIKFGARVSLVSDGKWYIGFGDRLQTYDWGMYYYTPSDVTNRFYSFDPATNSWTTISNVASPPRTFAISFTSGGKIYIGGSQAYRYYDFWEYDPQLDR